MSCWHRAFILHRYAYKETSLLIDFFVETKGRVRVLAKGIRRRGSMQRGAMQLFTPLNIQYSGIGNVKTLCRVEPISLSLPLSCLFLYSGFYINELVYRVVPVEADSRLLFVEYLNCLKTLSTQKLEPSHALRRFELAVLDILGYQADFYHCCTTGVTVVGSKNYVYVPERGFMESVQEGHGDNLFTGYQLQAFAKRAFNDEETLKAAKRFTRLALRPYVGNKPFKSGELFKR